jgi:hypothetical protein
MRSSGLLAAVCVMVACSMAAPAKAQALSCAAVVLVDGYQLVGISIAHRQGRLPRRGVQLRAVEPACSDEEEDRHVSVTALAGMPVRLAVAPEREHTTVYLADGSLVELADHPLHGAWYPDAGRPSFRRGRSCSRTESVAGRVIHPAGFTRLRLTTPNGERTLRVDARSRITNRPAYQPVLPGQQLSAQLVKCGRRHVADRIHFTGATIAAQRVERAPDDDGFSKPLLFVPAAILLISILLVRKV